MNAKEEFIRTVKEKSSVKCAYILHDTYSDNDMPIKLKINYDESDYNLFLESINFEYDNGYGGQELYGTIWFEDNTWMTRGEYDGSEWWEYNKLPEIPVECL